MLPNPVYGSWDQILPASVQERMSLLKRAKNLASLESNDERSLLPVADVCAGGNLRQGRGILM